jgi:DNA-binding NtrC family response regulator
MGARPLASRQSSTVIVGSSPATVRLRAEIDRIAPFSSNVLITGPSGTGKELVARQVHARSPRADEPFIPVDCASMSGELMSSQLFGHVAGAFTGANCDALGCFRAANCGTIFLDEIGELEFSLQAKLLRVLQEHVVTPVGSPQGELVDVRVVAATNRNLRLDVTEGRFREDLYYRLDVVHLQTTALRERPGDIWELADSFLGQLASEGLPACSLSPAASAVLVEFPWPGNVRQLRNVLEQAAIDSESPVITADLLRRIMSLSLGSAGCNLASAASSKATTADSREMRAEACAAESGPHVKSHEWLSLDEVERDHIARTLAHTYNNRSAAARLLGITRQALLRKMKRYALTGFDNQSP